MSKSLPFDAEFVRQVAAKYPTPFYLYDEAGIRNTCRQLNAAFAWNPGFREYFAVKALPNPYIVQIAAQEGLGADCSSLPELILSERVGLTGEDLMFTSNNTLAHEYRKAIQLGAIVNLDDLSHIDYLRENTGLPELLCFRYNPGSAREGNVIIGRPEEAKYGFTESQLFEGYRLLRDAGVKRFGLHTMVASNELNGTFFTETARMLFDLALRLHAQLGIRIEFVNLGGGIGIPYRPEQQPVDLAAVGQSIRELYESMIAGTPLHPLRILMENGRMITGPHGFLVTTAVHHKNIYRNYVGVDACMANLMRPGMYGAYHHITVLGREHEPHDQIVDVVGSLCENNDKFAIQRPLPKVQRGDLLVIHDSGAHGHAMGFQYNGKLRCAEILIQPDKSTRLIRRAETVEDYFGTLDFSGL
ncbi:MAG: Diaminopimelate decarboxylase [Planctomycetota bacterium]|jgi:diaminopimelate decarboxylase